MKISVIVPVYNEVENIRSLYGELVSVLSGIDAEYELIFIDDGSSDGSYEKIKEVSFENKNVKFIKFRKNYGQTAAMQAGFYYSSGDIVVTMDADLQNDPYDIPVLLKKIEEGYDVVSGWRKDRKDSVFRRIPSIVANELIDWLVSSYGEKLHDYGCTLKAYRKWVVKELKLYGEMHRFIPVFAKLQGARIAEVAVNHRPRRRGVSKYGYDRIFRVILDLVTIRFFATSMTRPMHFFGKISRWSVYAGLFVVLLFFLLSGNGVFLADINTYMIILGTSFIVSSQFIVLGLLGEMIMRSYFESSDKVPYSVDKEMSVL